MRQVSEVSKELDLIGSVLAQVRQAVEALGSRTAQIQGAVEQLRGELKGLSSARLESLELKLGRTAEALERAGFNLEALGEASRTVTNAANLLMKAAEGLSRLASEVNDSSQRLLQLVGVYEAKAGEANALMVEAERKRSQAEAERDKALKEAKAKLELAQRAHEESEALRERLMKALETLNQTVKRLEAAANAYVALEREKVKLEAGKREVEREIQFLDARRRGLAEEVERLEAYRKRLEAEIVEKEKRLNSLDEALTLKRLTLREEVKERIRA